jgi:hypothetical protein
MVHEQSKHYHSSNWSTSPPYHGSNIMTKITKEAILKLGYECKFINKKIFIITFSNWESYITQNFRIPFVAYQIAFQSAKFKPKCCIYFGAVGKIAFIIDFFYLFILRKFNIPYILRFDGKGYSFLQKEGHFWNKIVTKSLAGAVGGIVLGNSLKDDVNDIILNNRLQIVPNCVDEPADINFPKKSNSQIKVLFLSNLLPEKELWKY